MTICLKAYVTLRVEALYGKVPTFHVGGYWSRASGDMKYLISHVTSPNHMIEGSCNFECELLIVCHRDIVLVCHVILQHHVMKV